VDRSILIAMPQRMRARQMNFARTGGIHAAGLFDIGGNLLALREDLGRHNAVDKLLGAALRAGVNTRNALLMVSGRLGFEIAQKAVVAGIPITASVSAPSSLAIALAHDAGMTAIGFVRGASMNVYTHPQRVIYGLSKHSS
jgi:FdhD protein